MSDATRVRQHHFSTPEEKIAQRNAALERSRYVRTSKAQLKRDIKAGLKTVPEVLADRPDYINKMRLEDLMFAEKGVGYHSIRRHLLGIGVPGAVLVGKMTDRQITLVVGLYPIRHHDNQAQPL